MTTSNEPSPVKYENPEITPQEDAPGTKVSLPFGFGPIPKHLKNKKIFFFDIDNCLYKRSTQIHDMTQVKIHNYFKDRLQLDDESAHKLHIEYYQTYGLALEGLVRKHQVDALEYNSKVDDALDLKSVLKYNKDLRELLISIREEYDYDYFWLITNAYKNHALRVISFLGVGDLFDGLTFCDYSLSPIVCKPMTQFFYNTLTTTNVDYKDPVAVAKQTFIDDSEINCKAALDLGFGHVIHYVELDSDLAKIQQKPDYAKYYEGADRKITIISDILDLKKKL